MVINLGEKMRRTVFSISLLALLTSCDKDPIIERAEYLEKIFPYSNKAFISKPSMRW